ncbi:MFS transporter [Chloroflexota bacterium]
MFAHFGHHLMTALPVPLLPFIRDDFNLDYTQAGFVISSFTLAYGIGQLPAGWLADRVGPRILVTIGICGVALAGFLVGLSQSYIMMIFFLALMGVLGGGYHPASPPLITASVEPKNRGRALGLHMVGSNTSYFLAPLIAAAIAVTWGWRGSFIILAMPTMVFGVLFYVILGKLTGVKGTEPKITSSYHDKTPAPRKLPRLVAFIILNIFAGAVAFSMISFIPLFVVDQFGFSREAGAVFVAVFFFTGIWASPLGGYLSDRLGRMPVVLTACLFAGPAVYLLGLVPHGLGVGFVLVFIGMTAYVRMPVSEAYIVSNTSTRHRSSILGIYYFGNMEGMGVITPVIGYLLDKFGFYTGFTIIGAALMAVTLLCSIWLWGSRD